MAGRNILKSSYLLSGNMAISVYLSYDIFLAPLKMYDAIINPANEALCGILLCYYSGLQYYTLIFFHVLN